MRTHRSVPRDLLALWGGLLLLIMSVGAFMTVSNECAGRELAGHPSYDVFPGMNLDSIAPPVRQTLTTRLNQRYCTCGCLMTVASCLNNHASCRTSKRIGLEMIQSAHGEFEAAHRRN
jgi:hypothetical protein